MPKNRSPFRSLAAPALAWLLSSLLAVPALASDWIYVVAPGDNLWNLSEKYLGGTERVTALQRLNGIAEPRKMPPGIKLRVPMDWIPPSTPTPATVLEMSGTATLIHAGGASEPVQPSAELVLGDRLRTDPGGSLAVQFADGSVLTLHSGSEIRFDQLSVYGETGMVDSRAKVLAGRAEARVESAVGPGSRFEIATPSAISAVRGTEYRASVNDSDAANIEVLEGSVAVSAQQQEILVPSGYGTQVKPGAPPMPARALLAAPAFRGNPRQMADNTLMVRWGAIVGAESYRLETSQQADFVIVDHSINTTDNKANIGGLADGQHYLRVVALDDLGLAGLPAMTQASFKAVTVSPPTPAPKGSVTPPEPVIGEHYAGNHRATWQASPGYSYRVQVSRSSRFGDLEIDTTTEDALVLVPRQMDQKRFIRVRVMDGERIASDWSEPVTIAPALPSHHWPVILTPLLLLFAF